MATNAIALIQRFEGLSALKPYFDKTSGAGSVTPGNSSQLSDGASATLLMSRQRADQLGIGYKMIFRGFAVAGCEPDEMGIGPVFAVPKLLKRHNLKVDDIDLWELNEAFAAQVLGCLAAWEDPQFCRSPLGLDGAAGSIPRDRLNVDGGAIGVGHPVGASGNRIVLHLVNAMKRLGVKRGIATECIGGGQGGAMLIETV